MPVTWQPIPLREMENWRTEIILIAGYNVNEDVDLRH